MCFKYHKHCATDQPSEKQHMAYEAQKLQGHDILHLLHTATGHIHQKPMIQPTVQEYVAIRILGVFPVTILCTDHW
jgi:hypothetical protein